MKRASIKKPVGLMQKDDLTGLDIVGSTSFHHKQSSMSFINSQQQKNEKMVEIENDSNFDKNLLDSIDERTQRAFQVTARGGSSIPLKEKNQLLLSINCSKAIPVQGYNMICDIMQPFKSKLH